MAKSFAEQLQSELDGIQGEIDRLNEKRNLISQLLQTETGKAAKPSAAATSAPKAGARPAPARRGPRAKQARRPRGMITNKVREYLHQQSGPVHATQILKYLEDNDAAPLSAKPLPTLQSTLQRMKELGEIENKGRNRWQLISAPSAPAASPPAATAAAGAATPSTPPVVTSTRTFAPRN